MGGLTTQGSTGIRVFLVDDHPAMLDAIGRALAEAGIEVVGSARETAAALTGIAVADPDIVVCDVQMGHEAGGLRILEHFGGKDRPRILMLSSYDYPTLFRAAFDRGAVGYLLKSAEVATVVAAVRIVADGGTAFSAAEMRAIRTALRRPSEREIEVLGLIAAGRSNDEIATQLVLSSKTVESHVRRMFDRYAVMNRTELAVLALREGWITSADQELGLA
jgi:DNA-binding NarL/FixJ family response regulator